MKRFLLIISFLYSLATVAQTYNNEWIDFNKTYYKFKVGATGLYRISEATLASLGIGASPAEHFQLWRNGKEVPMYTSVATGPLGGGGYIEFWGLMNDGKPDKQLYRNPDFQLIDKYSFSTDTAAYFLTVNPAGGNVRLVTTINNVAGNSLPPEPYFMHTEGHYCKNYMNPGYFIDAGEYVHSSTYDRGENWVCFDIGANASFSKTTDPLYVYAAGPAGTFTLNVAGNAINTRRIRARINGDSILGQNVDFLNYARLQAPVPLTSLSTPTAQIQITNVTPSGYDRMVISQFELTYPRTFNFGNKNNFEFSLPANASGNYLEISNFNYGATAPVLYDITNGKRYVADISTPGLIKFALEPSVLDRQLVLVSQDASNINNVSLMTQKNFVNFANASLQGDYIIISNPILYSGASGNPVEDYRVYRSSAAGGGYNAKLYDVNELIDQFAFGIKKHPASVRNFLSWAKNNFGTRPKFVLLVGRAMMYDHYRYYESVPEADLLNLVPTYGSPASDWLLATDSGQYLPHTPIGRIAAITPDEVLVYLSKVIEYEDAQKVTSPLIADKAWNKSVVHVIGAADTLTQRQLEGYMNKYRLIISDTLFGGRVSTFSKSSADPVQQLSDQQLQNLFEEGITQLTYFGHSSATVLDFNLDNPERYNNQGKYPIFIVMGCNAGNFFTYNPARFFVKATLSEKFVLAPNRGSIAFIASSHFGIAHYLDRYNTQTYTAESKLMYGKSIGEILMYSIQQVYNTTSFNDFFSRMHTEENTMHGDPAIKLNGQPKPDYVIEEQLLKITPGFISIAETGFDVDAKFINMGKAVDQNIAVEIKRQYPDGSIVTAFKDTIPGIRYIDSVLVTLPIDPNRDKGLNRITITIDADGVVDEMYETNNSITKDIFIFEDEIRPIYPQDHAIVNRQDIKLVASTANPFTASKVYRMEIDTTELFNSSFKLTQNITSSGGIIEYVPGFSFGDSTVYYWRVSALDSAGSPAKWNKASFVYLAASDVGYNQSHFYQHTHSGQQRVFIDSADRKWVYHPVLNNIFVRSGIYPTTSNQQADYTIAVNGDVIIGPGCAYDQLIINVFDSVTFKPWRNNVPGGGLYGSGPLCGTQREYNFHFQLGDTSSRRKAMDFLNNIVPDGSYVSIRSNTAPWDAGNTYAATWAADTAYYGSGNSLYHTLKNQGFSQIDDFDTTTAFIFVYKKNRQATFAPREIMQDNIYEPLLLSVDCPTPDTIGYITSPVFGPAKEWKLLKWRGNSEDMTAGDNPTIDIIGTDGNGTETSLYTGLNSSQQDFDISSIDATQYPFVKLRMRNIDSVHLTPYQLSYWRLTYKPLPEGAVAPNILFQAKDTVEVGEPFDFHMAFKNISEVNFDSLRVKMVITDRNNVNTIIPVPRFKPLVAGDTVTIRHTLDTRNFAGQNALYVDVNPDNDQPEQFHFNNFIFRNLYVRPDLVNPLLDVTFDGVHILNRDIVSSKPHILVKLKDESKWMVLDDTSAVKVQVRFPDGSLRPFSFSNSDTLRFTQAGQAPNNDNTASIDFLPYFQEDGDYELIVSGKDRSGNTAGQMEYRVAFQVINKPMISNMLNYPNPFTTSTAFVFTITGSEVPQNIKIEIMTITGKIVREITKEELGPLHIGRNITEFKWDGTDQFGQKLANGIYLYRVVTNLNGKSLDKYKAEGDDTDKYFNKGYGKMYLMR